MIILKLLLTRSLSLNCLDKILKLRQFKFGKNSRNAIFNYYLCIFYIVSIENRIYREEFTRKKCKTAILFYCFHTARVLHIFMLYNLLGPGISFYRKSKIIVKRNSIYEIGWFHNCPMIIWHSLYAFHFSIDDYPL